MTAGMEEAAAERRRRAEEFLAGCPSARPARKRAGRKVSSLKGKAGPAKGYAAWRSCARKSRFGTQGEATAFLHRWETSVGCRGRVYPCSYCGGWHVTIDHSGGRAGK